MHKRQQKQRGGGGGRRTFLKKFKKISLQKAFQTGERLFL
jgi:hypothetical protein